MAQDVIEIEGMIDKNHHLILDNEDLPIEGPTRVKILIRVDKKKAHPALRFRGALKRGLDGLDYQNESRNDWDE